MGTKFKNLFASIAIALVFVVGISYIQAGWTGPTTNPPSANVDVPINLSSTFQDKFGTIEATTIAAANTICLNAGINSGDCITTWPSGGSGSASCHFEQREIHVSSGDRLFWDPGSSTTQYPTCDDYLTPEAKAAGWGASGGDDCEGVYSSDCQYPSMCTFTRLACSGITVAASTFSTSTYSGSPFTIPLNSPAL